MKPIGCVTRAHGTVNQFGITSHTNAFIKGTLCVDFWVSFGKRGMLGNSRSKKAKKVTNGF
jgi:hypothetical protein